MPFGDSGSEVEVINVPPNEEPPAAVGAAAASGISSGFLLFDQLKPRPMDVTPQLLPTLAVL